MIAGILIIFLFPPILSLLTAQRINVTGGSNVHKSVFPKPRKLLFVSGLTILLFTLHLLFPDFFDSLNNHAIKISIVRILYLVIFLLSVRVIYQISDFGLDRAKISVSEKNVLIYGTNENGKMILHKINNSPSSNLKIIGFLDDNPNLEGKIMKGYPVLGGYSKLPAILNHSTIKYIFICKEDIKPKNFNYLKKQAEARGIAIKQPQLDLKNLLSESDKNRISSQIKESQIKYI